MAGLIGTITNFSETGLGSFLLGDTAATKGGRVEQFRSNLRFDYGDIISGATSDGLIFDIRVNDAESVEFGDNLTFRKRFPNGVFDAGDSLVTEATVVRRRLEQNDLARLAQGLLLASKGEISQKELNTDPRYSRFSALDRDEALDRLNIDVKRTFRINGSEFKIVGDQITVIGRTGEGARAAAKPDSELAALRKQVAKKQSDMGVNGDSLTVPAKDASIGELIGIREDLERDYTFVAYSFKDSQFVASNSFKDVIGAVAEVPDAFFFGANVAWQLEDALGDTVPSDAKNDLFPVTLNYFSGLVLGALTGLPTQVRDEYYSHAEKVLGQRFGEKDRRVEQTLDRIRGPFEAAVQRVFETVAGIDPGAKLADLRKGLGITLNGSTYTVSKYALKF